METLPALKDNMVDLLISQAIDKNVPVEALEKLLAMRREWRLEVAEEEFNIAMTGFQSECPIIKKTKKVYGKSGYLYSYAHTVYYRGEICRGYMCCVSYTWTQ